jgi:hypothetical protein
MKSTSEHFATGSKKPGRGLAKRLLDPDPGKARGAAKPSSRGAIVGEEEAMP